ncbi:hypothetical protein Tco_1488015 [Tanacetum coccineum]
MNTPIRGVTMVECTLVGGGWRRWCGGDVVRCGWRVGGCGGFGGCGGGGRAAVVVMVVLAAVGQQPERRGREKRE